MLTEKGGFILGERVVLVRPAPDENYELVIGDEGIIVELNNNSSRYLAGIRWDKPLTFGHSCAGNCDRPHGWRVCDGDIDHITNLPEIVAEDIEALLFGGDC